MTRPRSIDGLGFLGERGLDGSVRPTPGTVCLAAASAAPVIVTSSP